MNALPPIIDTLLFDLDGTLIDSFEAFYQICKYGCDAIGLPVPERTALYPVMNEGASFFDLSFPADLPHRQAQINAFHHETRRVRGQLWSRYARLMPDAAQTIKLLRASGYKLAIVTSSGSEAFVPLERAGLTDHFDVMITRSDVNRRKPHPEGLETALRRLQSIPEMTIMVGDTPMDILAGRAAGAQTAGVLSSTANGALLEKHDPDMLFSSLSDLQLWMKLDAFRRSLPAPSVLLQGLYGRGLGKAAGFLSLDWVRQRIESITGFAPYPGTFNLDLLPASAERLSRFRDFHDRSGRPFKSNPGFCDAVLFPCKLQSRFAEADAFALFPLVPGYPVNKLEIIAPIPLSERLIAESAPSVYVTLYG